jgi:hypothetical protein
LTSMKRKLLQNPGNARKSSGTGFRRKEQCMIK